MKLLHTSDWHVGKTIRGISRADEHTTVLAEMAQIARSEEVDLVIVSGDLFDSSAPTAGAEEIVYRALLDLAKTGAQIAVIAGNHDNPRRLRAVAPLLQLGQVHLVAEPTRPEDGGVLHLRARSDNTDIQLAMLPFVSKRGIVRAKHLMNNEAFENAQNYSERMRVLIAELCDSFRGDTVNLLAAHTFVLGGTAGGGERPAHLVEEYAVTAQSFSAVAMSYGALGHLHRAQRVIPALHYCGSPLQLDFGETEQIKQVNIVTLEPGIPADVQAVPLTAGQPLRTFTGTLDEIAAMSAPDDAWLKVVVQGPGRADLAQTVRGILGPRVVDIRVESPTSVSGQRQFDHRNHSPQELFSKYLKRQNVEDTRVSDLFRELLDDQDDALVGFNS